LSKKYSVEAECSACGGSGVYSGWQEPKGIAVICYRCNGTGKHIIDYKPFAGRKRRKGIATILIDKGTINGVHDIQSMTYEHFLTEFCPEETPDD
jgi:DnaJ-class molecular chaperone